MLCTKLSDLQESVAGQSFFSIPGQQDLLSSCKICQILIEYGILRTMVDELQLGIRSLFLWFSNVVAQNPRIA